jgi:hypothetical protein
MLKRVTTFLIFIFFSTTLSATDTRPVKIAFLFSKSEKAMHHDARTAVKLLVAQIAESYHLISTSTFYKDFPTIYAAIKKGDVDCLIVSSKVYLEHQEELNPYLQDGWFNSETNEPFFSYYIIANSSDSYKNKNKLKISSCDSATLIEEVSQHYLDQKKIYLKTPTNTRALLNLFFDKTDVAIVPQRTWDTSIEMNPQLTSKLHVIYKTKPIFANLISFYTTFIKPEIRETFLKATAQLHTTTRGKQLTQLFKIKRLISFRHQDLQPLKAFYNEVHQQ